MPQLVSKYSFFTSENMCTCKKLGNAHFHNQFKVFTISNIKRIIKSFYCILFLLSADISLDPGPKNNLQPLDSNKWNVFKSKGFHLIHLNINNLLPKIYEQQYIAKSSCAATIGISESKLDESSIKNPNKQLRSTLSKQKQKRQTYCLLYQKWYKLHR